MLLHIRACHVQQFTTYIMGGVCLCTLKSTFRQIGDLLARVRSETEFTRVSVTNETYNDAEWVSINVNNLVVDNF
jgi:hypothetical protein